MKTETVHGLKIFAFIRTEVQDGKDCGYIVVQHFRPDEFVTAWYRDGDSEWSSGNYGFKILGLAVRDMFERAYSFLKVVPR